MAPVTRLARLHAVDLKFLVRTREKFRVKRIPGTSRGPQIYATPFSVVMLLMSLSAWLCVCRWGFRYNLKDREILSCLIVYFVVITLLNMLFLGHMQFHCTHYMGMPKHAQFLARTVMVYDNNLEKASRTLNSILSKEGIYEQFRYTRYFEKPTITRRRVNYERCRAIYSEDMNRKIKFVLRTNRVEPFPGCS